MGLLISLEPHELSCPYLEGEHMRYQGQTTAFHVRVEIMEQILTSLDGMQIATALGCEVGSVRKTQNGWP
jgi:hypothetical protein